MLLLYWVSLRTFGLLIDGNGPVISWQRTPFPTNNWSCKAKLVGLVIRPLCPGSVGITKRGKGEGEKGEIRMKEGRMLKKKKGGEEKRKK